MPDKFIGAANVNKAIQEIIPLLEDTRFDAPKFLYFKGWGAYGLAASSVLRAIAEHPPPSLREKFDKIIHLDCSRWESPRALQRVIADELELTQQVAADLDWQDEDDDFRGVERGSRAAVEGAARVIARSLVQHRCLVLFHNGSDGMVDLTSCGIPQPQLFSTKVLWTFAGRLRLTKGLIANVPETHLCVRPNVDIFWDEGLREESARDPATAAITPETATECCLYYLSLMRCDFGRGRYNWTTHASSYWVCDGIIAGGGRRGNQAWDLARALQQHLRLEDDPDAAAELPRPPQRWACVNALGYGVRPHLPPATTSLFLACADDRYSFPVLHYADQLRVLKLHRCTFCFSFPPFRCCDNLRFLGLDSCIDDQRSEEEEDGEIVTDTEAGLRLWVLDVRNTDWLLHSEFGHYFRRNIREVHINNGRIWRSNLAWSQLPRLRKLRVVKPTSSWETGEGDEFEGMVRLEHLDLSGNSTMRVLPSLSTATGLKTLVLDGCVGLEHVDPQALPPFLESLSLDMDTAQGADNNKDQKDARMSRISLAGCARLSDLKLRGPLPNLEELDLSGTAVSVLDLGGVAQVGNNLERVILVGCERLRSVAWPRTGMQRLKLLCIDTRAGAGGGEASCQLVQAGGVEEGCHHEFLGLADMRFLQSLPFLWRNSNRRGKMNLCWSSSSSSSTSSSKDNGGGHGGIRRIIRSYRKPAASPLRPLPKLPPSVYHDVSVEQQLTGGGTTKAADGGSAARLFQPLKIHMEIGEGASCDEAASRPSTSNQHGWDAMDWLMETVQSLHVHDSGSITTVAPEHMFMLPGVRQRFCYRSMNWYLVERCPKLETVFTISGEHFFPDKLLIFPRLQTFRADSLLMARSIWRRPPRPRQSLWHGSRRVRVTPFGQLRAIHLQSCPRLRYVLALSSDYTMNLHLETLHILGCGDLRQVFPVEDEFLRRIVASTLSADWDKGVLWFPKLKELYLHDLPSLQLICEAKMFAPSLETVYIRGCWGLRRLPATTEKKDGRPPVAVDCEKDWWDKLEWDGMESGHHPSLFQPRHSR
ncbi:hypothetical protein BS78_07G045200 [Paspalum vaginatum]|nr:hypothetical protein BS78_07G045200 [Paspalum vaginatum]